MPGESELAKRLDELAVNPIVVASHPRSGTHLAIDLLRKQFAECSSWKRWGERLDRLYCNVDIMHWDPGPMRWQTAIEILRRCSRPVVKTHALPDWTWWFDKDHSGTLDPAWQRWFSEPARFIYMYRDGRSVMCSYYLFCKGFDPEVRDLDFATFLRQAHKGRSRVGAWADHVRSWMNAPAVSAFRFEDAVRDTDRLLDRLSKDLEVTRTHREPLLPRPIRTVAESRLKRLLSTRPESSAILGDPKGPAKVKWQEQFSPEDRRFFHEEAGELLMELGYESSDAWV